jgi:hypothetical protein
MLVPARWRAIGAYVIDLPVTVPAADTAGREIWGYPKFVTDISFRLHGREVESVVHAPGGGGTSLVAIHGRAGLPLIAPPLDVITYTLLRGALLKTSINVRGLTRVRGPGSVALEIGPGTHRMTENLRTLGVGARPILIVETERFRSRLPVGVPVAVKALAVSRRAAIGHGGNAVEDAPDPR